MAHKNSIKNTKSYKDYTSSEISTLPKCERKRLCISEIRDTIHYIGPWSVNISHYARKYDFMWQTVDAWYCNLLKSIPPEKINNIKAIGHTSFRKALGQYEKIMVDPSTSPRVRLEAIKVMCETLKCYNDFLENFDLKPKVANELNLNVEGNINIDRILQIAKESKARLGKKD